jgi:hypothetical protein
MSVWVQRCFISLEVTILGWSGRYLVKMFHRKGGLFYWLFSNKIKGAFMCRRKEILIIIMVVVCFFGSLSVLYGFDEKQVQALKKTNKCMKCDLSGAKLNNLDLEYADISSANLSGADLSNSMLSNANLTKANLSGANLSGTNLSFANLSGADASKANLTNVFLDQATWTNGKTCKIGSIGACKQ